LLPLVVAFSTTFLLVPPVRRFALEWRVGDKPNGRKLHARAIPHLGGIAIFGGFFLALLVGLGTPAGMELGPRVLALLPGLLVLFGLGLVDDLRGLRASAKLAYQILGALCVVAMGAGLQPAGSTGVVLFATAAISIVWYVGICNGVNLVDGLDGLAAGTSALSALAFLITGLWIGEPAVVLVAMSLLGALLAFLRYNFHPARIFMGDTGSMFIGFTLAFLACSLVPRLGFWSTLLGSAVILGVPIMDTTTAVLRRLLAGRHIFEADGEHTHHRLMRAGFSHRGSVVVLYALAAAFNALGCGILLGRTMWFVWASVLGVAAAVAIALLSRRQIDTTWEPVVVHSGPPAADPVLARNSVHTEAPPERDVVVPLPPVAGTRS
jgi:UDP-GlcNAc:undecaprenyl-phosphate GlcNAc-1-phosphate transferase